jgi:hypothetical protein
MEKQDEPKEIFESFIASPTEPQGGFSFLQLSEPMAMPFLSDYEFSFPPTKVKETTNLESMKMTFMRNQPIKKKSTSIEPEIEATPLLTSIGPADPISTSILEVGSEVDRLIFLSPNQSKRFQKNRQIMQMNLYGNEKQPPTKLEPPRQLRQRRVSIDNAMRIREGLGLISTSQLELSQKKRDS